jgi:hypothetical protein
MKKFKKKIKFNRNMQDQEKLIIEDEEIAIIEDEEIASIRVESDIRIDIGPYSSKNFDINPTEIGKNGGKENRFEMNANRQAFQGNNNSNVIQSDMTGDHVSTKIEEKLKSHISWENQHINEYEFQNKEVFFLLNENSNDIQ